MGALRGWASETVAVAPNYSTFIACASLSAGFSQVIDGAVSAKYAREKALRPWVTLLVFDCPRGSATPNG